MSEKAVFITGASRGIGAEAAVAFAQHGYDVALGYQDPKKEGRLNGVIERIHTEGQEAIGVRGDITTDEGLAAVTDQVGAWKSLNALVLNAAGGLEKDRVEADPDYALHVNRDAQLALLSGLQYQLVAGSSVVFLTSDWAHKNGEVALPPFDYAPIASSKQAGEKALRDRQKELATYGSRLLVVTAGLVTGTAVGMFAQRSYPEFVQQQEAMGNVITAVEVGARVAEAVEDPNLPSGHTVWIGADEATFMANSPRPEVVQA